MKWHVEKYNGYCAVMWKYREVLRIYWSHYKFADHVAEKVAAAHNAVIDMAFDSPGNVS